MNERINILAEQAGLHCDGTPDCWDQEAIARFAALIVRECAEFANEHNFGVEGFTLGIGKAIEQHFGVEE